MGREHPELLMEPLREPISPPSSASFDGAAKLPRAFPQLGPSSGGLKISPQDWLDSWSGLDHRARMVVTSERIYVAGDLRAEQALALRHDLRLNAKRVELADPGGHARLEHLLHVEVEETRTIFIPRRRRGGHLMMRSTRLGAPPGLSLVGIAFWIANEDFVVEWPDFQPIFGLTSAEAKVIDHLIQGVAAEEISGLLHVSINTVRTHISHIYEKLCITCREELWRRLAPYRLN